MKLSRMTMIRHQMEKQRKKEHPGECLCEQCLHDIHVALYEQED